MEHLVMSFVRPLTDAAHADSNPGKVFIIVPRHRAFLADLLPKAFEGREDVEIVVDRRYGERRTRTQAAPVERRRAQRRRAKEEVIEVVVGGIGQPEEPRPGSA